MQAKGLLYKPPEATRCPGSSLQISPNANQARPTVVIELVRAIGIFHSESTIRLLTNVSHLLNPSTYTIRLNHRHKLFGRVLGGRDKALLVDLVDGRAEGYLKTVCDYVHLNAVLETTSSVAHENGIMERVHAAVPPLCRTNGGPKHWYR